MKYGRKNRKKESTKKFATGSGQLKTKFQADIKFTLPELSNSKIINWNFRLTDNEDLGYDMILGRDIMTKLGIDLSFDENIRNKQNLA